jgi:ribosomal protein S27AE
MTVKNITLDEALRPMNMTCGNCGETMTVYPCPIPTGTGVCPKCSPNLIGSFAKHLMNQERIKHGLTEI